MVPAALWGYASMLCAWDCWIRVRCSPWPHLLVPWNSLPAPLPPPPLLLSPSPQAKFDMIQVVVNYCIQVNQCITSLSRSSLLGGEGHLNLPGYAFAIGLCCLACLLAYPFPVCHDAYQDPTHFGPTVPSHVNSSG